MRLIRTIFYPTAIALAIAITSFALDAARLNRIASEQLSLDRSSEIAWKSVLERLTFSFYTGASEMRDSVIGVFAEAGKRDRLAWGCAAALFALSTIFALGTWWSNWRRRRMGPFLADLIAIAIIFLAVGLVAPILSLKAYTTVPVIGEVIFKYEVKSVLTTIGRLADSHKLPVAVLVATFSIVTPLTKLFVAMAVLQRRWPAWHERGLAFMHAVGKWSMADVFVVAVLVAYFAAGSDEFSEAQLGVGLYFFAAYCLVSQFATHMLARTYDTRQATAASVSGHTPHDE